MQLYKIANEYLSAFDSLSEIDGLDNETIENTLAPIKQDINKKAINIASYVKNLESDIDQMDEYIRIMKQKQKSMEKNKKSAQNRINSIKSYLRINMENCNISEISAIEFKIKLGAEDIRTEIFDESILPHYFCQKVVKLVPDKILIKEAILNGQEIDGVRLVKTKRLTIT